MHSFLVLSFLLGASCAHRVRPVAVDYSSGRHGDGVRRFEHSQSNKKIKAPSKQRMLAQLLFAQSPSAAYMPIGSAVSRLASLSEPCKTAMSDRATTKPECKPARHIGNQSAILSTLKHTGLEIKQEAKDLWLFISHPSPGPRLPGRLPGPTVLSDIFSFVKVKTMRRVLLWPLLLSAVDWSYLQLLLVIERLFPEMSISALLEANRLSNIKNFPIALGVFLGPTIEEISFRYPLRQLPPLWLLPIAHYVGTHSVSLLMLLPQFRRELAVLGQRALSFDDVARHMGDTFERMLVATIALRLFMVVGGDLVRRIRERVRTIFHRHYRAVVYLNCIMFALVHLSNFDFTRCGYRPPTWVLPLLVFPQLTGGLLLAWIRVRSGIGASIVAHMFNNGVAALTSY